MVSENLKQELSVKKTTTRVVIYQSFIHLPVFSGTFNSKTSPLGALRSVDINTPRKGRSCATLAAPTKASTYGGLKRVCQVVPFFFPCNGAF